MAEIVSDDGVRSGVPRIAETRITVVDVKRRVIEQGDDPHVVADEYEVPVADVFRALTFYYDNHDDLRRLEAEFEAARAEGERRTTDAFESDDGDNQAEERAD